MNFFFNKIIQLILFIGTIVSFSFAQEGRIVKLEIKSSSLQSNLIHESNVKNVYVYLPTGYDQNSAMRYPVVYLLHGFTSQAESWFNFMEDSIVQTTHINEFIREKKIRPFIIVMPDGHNAFGGGFYTNSITTGNWEDYIEKDLVEFIDGKFRTVKNKESRGIAGHSMGGYGALKMAIKHPDVFSNVYASSACCLAISREENDYSEKDIKEAIAANSWEDFNKLQFFSKAIIASAAAWSPNPSKPPFYADLPFGINKEDSTVIAANYKMAANLPVWMIDQNITNLKQLKGISFDVGTQEASIQTYNIKFSNLLKRNNIPHEFNFFNGGHVDKLKIQLENYILPFFSKKLVFE